jgi:dTMP kinase
LEEVRVSLIVLEGIDKSGKATQAEILAERLRKMGRRVEDIAFPDYQTAVGGVIGRYLQGDVDLCPELRQLLYAANRWERCGDLRLWLREGKLVVADRYVPSGLVYGLANGLDLGWMTTLERGLPPSDLVIVVDVSVATAFTRDETRDIYEANRGFLERVRRAYLALAEDFSWVIVDGERDRVAVAEQVWEHVSRLI